MPMLALEPGSFTIQDLSSEVIIRLENRTNDQERAYVWLRDALIEISGNPQYQESFEELEVLGPQIALEVGTQEFAFANFLPIGDYNLMTFDVLLWIDYPANTRWIKLKQSHFQETDKASKPPSRPGKWYRFGDSLGFDPAPDQPYQVQLRFMQRHPLAIPLETTRILIPIEWNEVLVLAACMRGFIEILEYEKAAQIRQLLYGDPKHPEKPGMIESVKKRRQREAGQDTRSLRPIVGTYMRGR